MLASPIIPGKAYRVKHAGHTIDVLASTGADAITAVVGICSGLSTTNDELLSELKSAHQIIKNALNLMTSGQKAKWGNKNARDGVDGEGITRANERAALIAKVEA